MRSKSVKIFHFQFVIYASILQLILLENTKLEIIEPFFLYGIPFSRNTAYHTILLGYWIIPVFFILLYFSGYISKIDDYNILLIIRYGRLKFYIHKIIRMILDLMSIVFLQFLITQHINVFRSTVLLKNIIQYYTILLLLILIENLIELLFERMKNINIFINMFILASIIIYNFSPIMRRGMFKLVNMLMIIRIPSLTVLDICLVGVLLVICISCMWVIIKKKDLLGDVKND